MTEQQRKVPVITDRMELMRLLAGKSVLARNRQTKEFTTLDRGFVSVEVDRVLAEGLIREELVSDDDDYVDRVTGRTPADAPCTFWRLTPAGQAALEAEDAK